MPWGAPGKSTHLGYLSGLLRTLACRWPSAPATILPLPARAPSWLKQALGVVAEARDRQGHGCRRRRRSRGRGSPLSPGPEKRSPPPGPGRSAGSRLRPQRTSETECRLFAILDLLSFLYARGRVVRMPCDDGGLFRASCHHGLALQVRSKQCATRVKTSVRISVIQEGTLMSLDCYWLRPNNRSGRDS
jgi:hypothetical protein